MAQRQIAMAQMQRDLAAAQIDRQLAKVELKMDKVRMITIDRANRARNCSGLSRVVVAMPPVAARRLSNLPDIQIPDMSEIPQAPAPERTGHLAWLGKWRIENALRNTAPDLKGLHRLPCHADSAWGNAPSKPTLSA